MASNFLGEMGEKIKKARKEKKMSQEDLAKIANCSPQLISKIEKGQVDTKISTLLSIQKAAGIKESIKGDTFFEELMEWAKETGGSENTEWLKNQIENFFPMFKEWRKRKEEGNFNKTDERPSKVA